MRTKEEKVKGYWHIVFYNPNSLPRTLLGKWTKTVCFYIRSHMRPFPPTQIRMLLFILIIRTGSLNTFPFHPVARRLCAKCHVKITTVTVVPAVSTFLPSTFSGHLVFMEASLHSHDWLSHWLIQTPTLFQGDGGH